MNCYTHLTPAEREKIHVLLVLGTSYRGIARALGRAVSSITREVNRNRKKNGSYSPFDAQTR